MTGELTREPWIVPVAGLTGADPEGIVQTSAHPDGTVSLDLACGTARITVRLDVCRAAQLCTGIWEAAGAAQHLTGHLDDDPPQPPPGAEDLPEAWREHLDRNTPPRRRTSPRSRGTRLTPANNSAVRDATRMIGLLLRRIRHDQDKSLEVISGLAGMSHSTLHHIEYGRRELTLSEIVALAGALQIDPRKLIKLPLPAPPNEHTDTTGKATQSRAP